MARATSGLGQFRGKVGSVVFRVSQGQQIASAYQPAIRNPKSNLQTAQRNKLYLASQLSSAIQREDIVGLNPTGTPRDRRGLFLRNIIENTYSRLDGAVFLSSISYKDVKLSRGISMIASVENSVVNSSDLKMSLMPIDEEIYNKMAIKAISFQVDANGGIINYKSQWLNLPKFTEVENNSIQLSLGVPAQLYNWYFIPVQLNETYRVSREKKTLVQFIKDQEFAITGEYAITNAVLKWGDSVAFTSLPGTEVIPPSGSEDEVVNPDGPIFPNLG